MNCLVFDIETVPDVELGRRMYGSRACDDAAVAKAMFARQRERTGSDFLPHIQQRVVAIGCALRTRDQLRLWSLGRSSTRTRASCCDASSRASRSIRRS